MTSARALRFREQVEIQCFLEYTVYTKIERSFLRMHMRRILVLLAVLLVLMALPVHPCVADTSFTGVVTYRSGKNVYLQNGATGKLAFLDSSNDAALMEQVKRGKVVTVSGAAMTYDQAGYSIPEITDAMILNVSDSGASASTVSASLGELGNGLMAVRVRVEATKGELVAAQLQLSLDDYADDQMLVVTGVLSANTQGRIILGASVKPKATPEPTAAPTPAPTAEPTPAPTPVLEPTATSKPTSTPGPVLTATPEPTSTPTPEPTATTPATTKPDSGTGYDPNTGEGTGENGTGADGDVSGSGSNPGSSGEPIADPGNDPSAPEQTNPSNQDNPSSSETGASPSASVPSAPLDASVSTPGAPTLDDASASPQSFAPDTVSEPEPTQPPQLTNAPSAPASTPSATEHQTAQPTASIKPSPKPAATAAPTPRPKQKSSPTASPTDTPVSTAAPVPTDTPMPTDTPAPIPSPTVPPASVQTPTPLPVPIVEKESTSPPQRNQSKGNAAPSAQAEADPPSSTPSPEEPAALELSGLLFLGGIGSMALGCIYGLIHAVKKKKRSKKGSRRSRKARRSRR